MIDADATIRIIDWDNVSGVPINLSAVSLAESFWRSDPRYSLNKENFEFFQTELSRIEQKTSSASNFSDMLLHSREHMFLREILVHYQGISFLKQRYPEIVSEALERSPKNIAIAASLWAEFSNTFYISRGRPIPDIPLYVEIQEGLGMYERGSIQRFVRRIKEKLTKSLSVLLDKLLGRPGTPKKPTEFSFDLRLEDL
jgi:hypothetical protein